MKIALITGGSRGLGRNAAIACARKGIDSIITYNSSKSGADEVVQAVKQEGRKCVALPLDVSKAVTFNDFAATVGEVLESEWGQKQFNFLVNNAGTGFVEPLASTTEEQFDEMMNIHLKGPFFLTQKLLPLIADGGRIVNISSGLARFAMPGSGAYGTLKGGLEVLTRYMAKEFGARRIAANIVAPGAIETDFRGGAVRDNKEVNQQIASVTALGRVGLPDDIGGVIASLFTEELGWVNAQRIEVSGGMLI